MIVCICGSRTFTNYEMMSAFLNGRKITKVISGGARGADRLGERYAKEHGAQLEVIKPNWELFGKRAGMMRNEIMADKAEYVFAFWEGESRGTKHMIEYCFKKQIPIEVYLSKTDD